MSNYSTNRAFYADTIDDLRKEIRKRSGCEVRESVFPTFGEMTYYVSVNGYIFGISSRIIHGKHYGYGPLKPESYRSTQTKLGVKYTIRDGGSHEKHIWAEQLVYCTFVLGKWDETVSIAFKDGNPANVHIDNLIAYKEIIKPEWIENMKMCEDIYKHNFSDVVDFIIWNCNLSRAAAKDVAQDAFIWITTNREMPDNMIGAWKHWSKFFGKNELYNITKVRYLDDIDSYFGKANKTYEIDLFGLIKDEKRREAVRLCFSGYTKQEAADLLGIKMRTLRYYYESSINYLRDYLKKDKEMMKIYAKDTP